MSGFEIGSWQLNDAARIFQAHHPIALNEADWARCRESEAVVAEVAQGQEAVYGINTGFGKLAHVAIRGEDLSQLQYNLVVSHAAGVGEPMDIQTTRLMMALKINALAQGFSGISETTLSLLLALYNAEIYPVVPVQGSVGASGDLAPLAHMSLPLLGVGEVFYQGQRIAATAALSAAGLAPVTLQPKDGLALLNGTQASLAFALRGWFLAQQFWRSACISGALTIDAGHASDRPFDLRIHQVRQQKGQQYVAYLLNQLLTGSEIRASHEHCNRVQDVYSLRCQPQVMGCLYDQLTYAGQILGREINAVTDNPLVFAKTKEIISGGNFHAEPVGLAADATAIAIAEIGSIVERRVAFLSDSHLSGLPPFLIESAGLNSGFMIAQYTAAALASENKSMAFPNSVDSIPTSANQEDHVSMATHGSRRLFKMAINLKQIVAIELLLAAQGIDFHRPYKTSQPLEAVHATIREKVAFRKEDGVLSDDIAQIAADIQSGTYFKAIGQHIHWD